MEGENSLEEEGGAVTEPDPESEEKVAPYSTEALGSGAAPAPAPAGTESLQAAPYLPHAEQSAAVEAPAGDEESPIAAMSQAFAPLQMALQGALAQLDERSSSTRKTTTALDGTVQELARRVSALAERLDGLDGGEAGDEEEAEVVEMGSQTEAERKEAPSRRASLARAPSRTASMRRIASMGGVAGVLERLSVAVEQATSRLDALESSVGAPEPATTSGGEEELAPALFARVQRLEAEAQEARQRAAEEGAKGSADLEARVKTLEEDRARSAQLEELAARVSTVESLFARGEGSTWSLAPAVEAGTLESARRTVMEALEPRLAALDSAVSVAKDGAWAAMARATAVEEALDGEGGVEEKEEGEEKGAGEGGGDAGGGESKGEGGETSEGGRRRKVPLGQRLRALEEEVERMGNAGSLRKELSQAVATAQGADTRVQKQGQAVQRLRDHLQELVAEVEEMKSPTLSAREAAAHRPPSVSSGAQDGGGGGGGVAPAALRKEVDELRKLVEAATGGGTPASKQLSRRVEDVEGAQEAATEELRRLDDEIAELRESVEVQRRGGGGSLLSGASAEHQMRVRHLMSEDKVKEMEALLDTRKALEGKADALGKRLNDMASDIHALRLGKADLSKVQAMVNKLHASMRDDVATLVAPKADKVQTRMQVDSAVSGKADRAYVDSVLETLRRQSRHLLEEMDGIRDADVVGSLRSMKQQQQAQVNQLLSSMEARLRRVDRTKEIRHLASEVRHKAGEDEVHDMFREMERELERIAIPASLAPSAVEHLRGELRQRVKVMKSEIKIAMRRAAEARKSAEERWPHQDDTVAAAGHSRCLSCDQPINDVSHNVYATSRPVATPDMRSTLVPLHGPATSPAPASSGVGMEYMPPRTGGAVKGMGRRGGPSTLGRPALRGLLRSAGKSPTSTQRGTASMAHTPPRPQTQAQPRPQTQHSGWSAGSRPTSSTLPSLPPNHPEAGQGGEPIRRGVPSREGIAPGREFKPLDNLVEGSDGRFYRVDGDQ